MPETTVRSRLFAPEDLHRIFYAFTTRFGRVLDRAGYVRFRRWRVYAERGLRGERDRDEPLARCRVTYQRDKRRLKAIAPAHLFEVPPQSPQLPIWAPTDDEWLRVLRLPDYARRRLPSASAGVQLPLFTEVDRGYYFQER